MPSKKKKKSNNKLFSNILKICFTAFLVLMALFAIYVVMVIASASMEDMDVDKYIMNYSGQIYYKNNETGNYENLDSVYSSENRLWVPITKMPEHLKDAAVAIEDERFYQHNGIDLKRTFGAVVHYIIDKDSAYGGSTITQQLVKNLTGQKDRKVSRKIKEIWNSFRLERKMSKDQILELYLNTMYLSQGCNGVGAAAQVYFDKKVDELTIAESAAIVGITQYPTRYDPFLNPENNKKKQELVLKKMFELEFITEDEYEDAKAEKMVFSKHNMNDGTNFNSYFVDQVIIDVANDLVKYKGYEYDAAIQYIHTGGIKIYSTIDPDIQRKMDAVYNNEANFGSKGAQSSMVIMDPYTGEVKGIAGGVGKKGGDFVLNRATMSKRQPGSSIKPLSVYAPAVEEGLISPMTIYEDKAVKYGDWSPVNYYSGFKGPMTVQYAVQISANTVPIQILEKLGVDKSYNFLKNKLGISTLVSQETRNGKVVSDKNLPALALGGLTDGITTYEMTAAYCAFVNNGVYISPHTYTKVVDSNGKIILEKKISKTYAMSKQTAQIMCQLLHSVTKSGGTGVAANLPNVQVGGKTGTTDDNKDRWFVGITPYYVGAVWYGFDNPKDMGYLTNNPALNAWKKVMLEVHSGLKYKAFPGASNEIEVKVCSVSGDICVSTCVDEAGNSTGTVSKMPYSSAPQKQCDPNNHKLEVVEPPSDEENNTSEETVPEPDEEENNTENQENTNEAA